jgi:hypothetical protein
MAYLADNLTNPELVIKKKKEEEKKAKWKPFIYVTHPV